MFKLTIIEKDLVVSYSKVMSKYFLCVSCVTKGNDFLIENQGKLLKNLD